MAVAVGVRVGREVAVELTVFVPVTVFNVMVRVLMVVFVKGRTVAVWLGVTVGLGVRVGFGVEVCVGVAVGVV